MKKGFSLLEVVVAMGIFTIIATLVVGAFVMISQMRVLVSITRENQQKTRVAMEMITRLSRQADKVFIQDEGKTLILRFNTDNPTRAMESRFQIGPNGELFYGECSGPACTVTTHNNIYRGVALKADSHFEKIGTIPAKLRVFLNGNIELPGGSPTTTERRAYYSNEITLETLVILERIR